MFFFVFFHYRDFKLVKWLGLSFWLCGSDNKICSNIGGRASTPHWRPCVEVLYIVCQGAVHRFEADLPATLDTVQTWLVSVLSGDAMHTGMLCHFILHNAEIAGNMALIIISCDIDNYYCAWHMIKNTTCSQNRWVMLTFHGAKISCASFFNFFFMCNVILLLFDYVS